MNVYIPVFFGIKIISHATNEMHPYLRFQDPVVQIKVFQYVIQDLQQLHQLKGHLFNLSMIYISRHIQQKILQNYNLTILVNDK